MHRSVFLISAMALLTACADPLAEVPRLSDVAVADTDPAAAALPSEDELSREGFFGPNGVNSAETPAAEESAAPAKPGGLFGLFRRAAGAAAAAPEPRPESDDENVEVARLTPEDAPGTAATDAAPRGGLFSGLLGGGAPAKDDNLVDVAHGTIVPYGVIARSCDTKRRALGKKVETSSSGFKLYDTNPGISGQRTFYITGFDDGCPRQLTASNVLLGAPSFYEQLHYGPAGAHLPVGETDTAYEKVKRQVCGSAKGKPCGARINSLERRTVFVNAYALPRDNASWSEMLIHDGSVVATSRKSSS